MLPRLLEPAAVPELRSPPATPDARPWQHWAAWVALAGGAAPRIWAAIFDQSLYWPDEIYQSLEQAHRFAFGYGVIPWEFYKGARSWLFPGILGLFWKLLSALGVRHSFGLVVGAKLLMVAAGLICIELARRLAERLAGPTAGLIAALFVAFCPLEIFFGARAMSEMASAPLLLAAAYLALVAARRRPAWAGALAAAAIYFRYQNGLVAAAYLVILAMRRDWPAAKRYLLAATAVGIAGGMLDWVTWSYPFQSFWVYVKFNLIDGKASEFGTSPFGFYAQHLELSVGAGLGVLGLGLAASFRRARGLLIVTLLVFLIHGLIPHKELRFLMPLLPLALALSAVGLTEMCLAFSHKPAFALGVALATTAAMGAKAIAPTQREYGRSKSDARLWHSGQDYFVVQWEAAKKADLCGIALVDNERWWTGGYTYLHRRVPIYFDLRHLKAVNYVVGGPHERLPAGWKRIYTHGKYALWRRAGTCSGAGTLRPRLN